MDSKPLAAERGLGNSGDPDHLPDSQVVHSEFWSSTVIRPECALATSGTTPPREIRRNHFHRMQHDSELLVKRPPVSRPGFSTLVLVRIFGRQTFPYSSPRKWPPVLSGPRPVHHRRGPTLESDTRPGGRTASGQSCKCHSPGHDLRE